MRKLTVLGGSSPFTASLIDSIKDCKERLEPSRMVLHGRTRELLTLIESYANAQLQSLGWQIETETEMALALADADIVLHQIRYGGLELRHTCETICAQLEMIADETLGLSALLTAMTIREEVQFTAEKINAQCPDAWILNLTNPLSTVTTLMNEVLESKQCVGLCELPEFTLKEVCRAMNVPDCEVDWEYFGLNHRGFIFRAERHGTNLILALPEALGENDIGGINASTIKKMNAVPLKYFRLVLEPDRLPVARANALNELRTRIALELRESPDVSPPSLAKRYTKWYPLSVVPMLQSLQSAEPHPHVLTVDEAAGIAFERHVLVSRNGIEIKPQSELPESVKEWIEVFKTHEQQFVACVRKPSLSSVERVLESDPTVDSTKVKTSAALIWDCFQSRKLPGTTNV